jgi:hypothetical protein
LPAFCVPYGYNEGKPVDSADCDALVSDLLAAYRQALTFKTSDEMTTCITGTSSFVGAAGVRNRSSVRRPR